MGCSKIIQNQARLKNKSNKHHHNECRDQQNDGKDVFAKVRETSIPIQEVGTPRADRSLSERRDTLDHLACSEADSRSISRSYTTTQARFTGFDMPPADVACTHPVILVASASHRKSGVIDAKKSGNLLGASCREIRFWVQTIAQEPRERRSAGSGDQRLG